MDQQEALAALPVLVLRLKIAPQRALLRLPAANKGNTLRGAFGMAFRRLVCIPQCKRASDCPLDHRCPYRVIFEPSPPPDAERLTKSQDSPRPFALRPPLNRKTAYAPGEHFEFGLTLIGRAVDHLPYFVLSFRDVACAGLGIGRATGELAEVQAMSPHSPDGTPAQCIYSGLDQLFHAPVTGTLSDWVGARLRELAPGAVNGRPARLTVRFLTPTSLKFEGRPGGQPEFHHLFKRVRDRLNALCTFYGPGPMEADFKGLGARAEEVRTLESELTWVERSRVSSKTHQRHELGGFVGACTYQGRIAEFLPWLAAGELIGAGRHTAWGNGQYIIS